MALMNVPFVVQTDYTGEDVALSQGRFLQLVELVVTAVEVVC